MNKSKDDLGNPGFTFYLLHIIDAFLLFPTSVLIRVWINWRGTKPGSERIKSGQRNCHESGTNFTIKKFGYE